MSDTCDRCGRAYAVVYNVPNEVWAKIAPHKDTLGDYPEHQYGGMLCPDCANNEATKLGIRLCFHGKVMEE